MCKGREEEEDLLSGVSIFQTICFLEERNVTFTSIYQI